jgi:hypothetical protein
VSFVESGLIRGMASFEKVDILVVFYYLSTSEIMMDKRGCPLVGVVL